MILPNAHSSCTTRKHSSTQMSIINHAAASVCVYVCVCGDEGEGVESEGCAVKRKKG